MADEPTRQQLPSKEELAALPQRAAVIYAFRNALRVLPLFVAMRKAHLSGFASHLVSLIRVLDLTKQYCEGLEIPADQVKSAYSAACDAANKSSYRIADITAMQELPRGSESATIAAYAADSARDAGGACAYGSLNADACYSFAIAAAHAAVRASADCLNCAAVDFHKLQSLSTNTKSEFESFDLGEAGPLGSLWMDHVPPWYFKKVLTMVDVLATEGLEHFWYELAKGTVALGAESSMERTGMLLKLEIPSGISNEEATRLVNDLILGVNELNRAYGGSGFTIDRTRFGKSVKAEVGS